MRAIISFRKVRLKHSIYVPKRDMIQHASKRTFWNVITARKRTFSGMLSPAFRAFFLERTGKYRGDRVLPDITK